MRVLGIDFGERRIGLALSDPTGTLASPLPTLKRRAGKRPPIAALAEVVAQHGAEAIVMGLPLTLEGTESDWTRAVREAGEKLSGRTGIPVYFEDERFTSVISERLVRSSGLPRAKREEKERVDAQSAVLILQAWLDRQRPGPGHPHPGQAAEHGQPSSGPGGRPAAGPGADEGEGRP